MRLLRELVVTENGLLKCKPPFLVFSNISLAFQFLQEMRPMLARKFYEFSKSILAMNDSAMRNRAVFISQ